MKPPVTRDISPEEAHDLLLRVPRACVALATPDGPLVTPVTIRLAEDGQIVIRLPDGDPAPETDQEIVLLVDEGVQFFDLRAIYLRGTAGPVETAGASREFRLAVDKTMAWDYGRLREVRDDAGR